METMLNILAVVCEDWYSLLLALDLSTGRVYIELWMLFAVACDLTKR